MKKQLLILCIALGLVISAQADISIRTESTGFLSYGIAGEDQMLPTSAEPGLFYETRNGYLTQGKLQISGGLQNRYDYVMDLSATSRTGSPYLPLQMSRSGVGAYQLNIDNLYARLYLSRLFVPNLNILGAETRINVLAGKFGMSARDASVSGFGLESSQNMISLANQPALAIETVVSFPGSMQMYRGGRANLRLDAAVSGLTDEAVQRLYDTDGGVSSHGRPVVGEYATQAFAGLSLNNYQLPFGFVSAAINYALNGAGIYSGHSAGAYMTLVTRPVPDRIHVPIAVSGAFYEKNIDVLAAMADASERRTTSLRNTIKAGAAVGVQYYGRGFAGFGEPVPTADLTISGSYSNVDHIYRDPINLISLGIDGEYSVLQNLYLGGGAVLGTLTDVTWETSDGVSSAFDNFSHVFTLAENFGYEAYLGFEFFQNVKMSIGFANMRGLSINRGLESMQSGMVKLRQEGTATADRLYETRGVFVRTTIKL